MSPTAAAEDALRRISRYYPNYSGALVTVNITGNYGQLESTLAIFIVDRVVSLVLSKQM